MTIEGGQFRETQQNAVPKVEVKLDTSDRSQASDEVAEDLLTPQNLTDQILVDIFEARFEDAKIALGPSYNQISEEFARMIDQGFTYQGISKNTDTPAILWSKEDQTTEKSFQDYFSKKEDYEKFITLFEGQKLTSAKEAQKDPEKQAHEFCTRVIAKFLNEKGFNLNYDEFMNSDMVAKELLPVLKAGYEGNSPYTLTKRDKGFALENKSPRILPKHEFVFSDYDSKLNLKIDAENSATNEIKIAKSELVPTKIDKKQLIGDDNEVSNGFNFTFPSGNSYDIEGDDEAHALEVVTKIEKEQLKISKVQELEFSEEAEEAKMLRSEEDMEMKLEFWDRLAEKVPELRDLRDQIRDYNSKDNSAKDVSVHDNVLPSDFESNLKGQLLALKDLGRERKDYRLLAALALLE